MTKPESHPLRARLLRLGALDLQVRCELQADGSLQEHRYHPRMEEVHRRNAAQLAAILDEHGWPGQQLVGADGARAAWLVAQHAISEPPFMKRALRLLQQAVAAGEAPAWQAAYLEDRICMFEGRPQIYGTQFEPGADGMPVPYAINDPAGVDARRRAVGLNTLAEKTRELRAKCEGQPPASPPRSEAYEEWLGATGWRG